MQEKFVDGGLGRPRGTLDKAVGRVRFGTDTLVVLAMMSAAT